MTPAGNSCRCGPSTSQPDPSSQGLEAICEGGMLAYEAAMVPEAPSLTLESYLHHTARGTGKLIGNTCQCSAILSGHSRDSQISRACMVFGEEARRDHADSGPRSMAAPAAFSSPGPCA